MTTYPISALLTSLPLDFEPAVRQAAALGFRHVDLVALSERPPAHVDALADADVLVSCCPIGRGLPDAQTLDAPMRADRVAALDTMKRHIGDAARLGATNAYIIPGLDADAHGLDRFAEACALLADFAAQRMVKLCVEHIPGRALPTAAGTLAWLETIGHPNLFLLVDVGHCLISGEDPAAIVAQAASRLGYIHFDDNDGAGDLHWPLLTGRLTQESLHAVLDALPKAGYRDALALELNPENADPEAALREGKELLERYGR
jgi:sugar phosphate isomerase/epimerase